MASKQLMHPRRAIFFHSLRTFLILCCIALGIALFEGIGLVVLIVTHLLTLTYIFLVWLCAACVIIDLSVATIIVRRTEARALRRYIQAVQEEWFPDVYIPLNVLSNVYNISTTLRNDPAHNQAQKLEELIRQDAGNYLLLSMPGGGKTIALLACRRMLLEHTKELIARREEIPVLLSMEDYNDVLRMQTSTSTTSIPGQEANTHDTAPDVALLDYLYSHQLPSIQHLRPHLKKWIAQRRILFLCDGLQDVDDEFLPALCQELREIMQDSHIRLLITCRELDYRKQPPFETLVSDEYAREAFIAPLNTGEIGKFVKQYMANGTQETAYEITPGQVPHLIQVAGLQDLCSNPFVLSTLLETLKGNQSDTRGFLLQHLVLKLIERESGRKKWQNRPFTPTELIFLLSRVACVACRMKSPYRIRLGSSPSSIDAGKRKYQEWATILEKLLDDPPIEDDVDTVDEEVEFGSFPPFRTAEMLRFAEEAVLISITSDNVLSFSDEAMAGYFAAMCLYTVDKHFHKLTLPFGKTLITNMENWREPTRIWAGLLPQPMELADRLARLGLTYYTYGYGYNALTLALMCVGLRWKQAQAGPISDNSLPESLKSLLRYVVRNENSLDGLVRTFDRCALEGGVAVYRLLLPLLRYPGITDLLLRLNKVAISKLLFEELSTIIDKEAKEAELRLLKSTLGKLGSVVIPQAIDLSKPSSGLSGATFQKHWRLRKAAIEILGRTHERKAAEALIPYLQEGEEIRNEAINALRDSGPKAALASVLNELTSNTTSTSATYRQWATLEVLDNFLTTHPLDQAQYQEIVEKLIYTLSPAFEPPIQKRAKELLSMETRAYKPNRERVIELLIRSLSGSNASQVSLVQDILVEIGPDVVPRLRISLNHAQSSDIMKIRITEVLGRIPHDQEALAVLLAHVGEPWGKEQRKTGLIRRAPESIPPLIDIVLSSNSSDQFLAAFDILKEMSQKCVMQVIVSLSPIVPGRTQLLVQVLESSHDRHIIKPLLELLEVAKRETDPALAKAVIHALSQLPDKKSIIPLLEMLKNPGFYEEASQALSFFGGAGLDELTADLIAALDNEQDKDVKRGVRHALSLMTPFPDQQLLDTFAQCSDAQAQQIIMVFRSKREAVAEFLVSHLCHQNEQIRHYVRQTLDGMEERSIVPALLDANHKECRSTITQYLAKYPQSSVPPLVNLLVDRTRGPNAALTLIDIGPIVIPSLVPGLNDQRSQGHTKRIIVNLIQRHVQVLPEVIRLFIPLSSSNNQSAYQALLDVLINSSVDVSTPALLEELASENPHVRKGVVEALVRLVQLKNAHSEIVLQELGNALKHERRRLGARSALEQIGSEKVVEIVDTLIQDEHASVNTLSQDERAKVKQVALVIMSNIGPSALPTVYNYMNDPQRRRDGEYVLRNMETTKLKDALVQLLSKDTQDVEIALTLLLECVRIDVGRTESEQMLPTLLEGLQAPWRERVHLRIIAFLLLEPREQVLDYLNKALTKKPYPQAWLTPLFLLLNLEGDKAKKTLLELEQNFRANHQLHIDLVSILSMLEANPIIEQYIASVWQNTSFSQQPGTTLFRGQLETAQHALGGLLASGKWNIDVLRQQQRKVKAQDESKAQGESIEHEFYSVLLGESYVERITSLRQALANEKDLRIKEKKRYEEQIRDLQGKKEQMEKSLGEQARKIKENESKIQNLTTELANANKDLGVSQGENAWLKGRIRYYENLNNRGA